MTDAADKPPCPPEDTPVTSPQPLAPAPDFGPTDRFRGWVVTLVLSAIAAATRFVLLGYPTDAGTPVFDEKHYVPQAWQMLHGGWIEDNPGYELVVHPPLAKQLIAIGEAIFGYTGFGWRFASAVVGTVLVLLVIRIARRMARSTLVGAIAGILVIADGVTFVSSRLGMLDIFQALFVVAAFGALIVDRDQVRRRLHRVWVEGRIADTPLGPRLGFRWWRFTTGVMLGLACACKWGGLYYVAFFGLLCVGFDVAARRAYGVQRPWLGTFVRDSWRSVASLVVLPLGLYLASFWAWFASEIGVDRHVVGYKVGTDGDFSFVPPALRGLWYYSGNVLNFHEHLTNSAGYHHPWESKPWTWPMGLRPMLYYFAQGPQVKGCDANECVRAMMLVGTPAMWWLAVPLLAWATWCTVVRRDWRFAAALVGYLAGFLPWFLNLDRQMYYFYAVPMAPFMVILLALTLGQILGRARAHPERRTLGLMLVSGYVALVVVNFIWLWPILTAGALTPEQWQQQLWLPSWR
ncbi:phospholipid carrier-dependent glycosyltransferase [Rhodococcus sp. D2-41]|uniref:dolichyl-phosphate-mannose--protein mannosyltransferase n=1 Tax=Speluncibacter jeojiensis TaxID=2710754 RepID=UPI002410746F|nr:phospholipid carrier-dependent glycosyltransferase [Rhodococcus sp. D2-41]MDG3012242.1 phospholipid carrier-dependent glycosyltransferase [Rhodococcus sp. D2-41]